MHSQLKELRTRLMEASDLQMAAGVLRWDQTTYMPPGGADCARPPTGAAGPLGARKAD